MTMSRPSAASYVALALIAAITTILCSVVSVRSQESVMSRSSLRLSRLGGACDSIEALNRKFGHLDKPVMMPVQASLPLLTGIPLAEEQLADLDLSHKCALVQMSAVRYSRALWSELRTKFDCPPFTLSTFKELRERGLAELPAGKFYHRLTMRGAQISDLAARALQKEYSIHVGYIGGNTGATTSCHCTCGWSCGLPRYNADNPGRIQSDAARAIAGHIHTVERMKGLAGALVPPTKEQGT